MSKEKKNLVIEGLHILVNTHLSLGILLNIVKKFGW
jgi:hypothetical protein